MLEHPPQCLFWDFAYQSAKKLLKLSQASHERSTCTLFWNDAIILFHYRKAYIT